MPSTARYRYLLERVYLDLVSANSLLSNSGAQRQTIINVLEFKPFDASFYNVGFPLPEKLPSEILGGRVATLATAPCFDENLFPIVLEAFQRVREQVEKVFGNFATMVSRNEWFPAILSPGLGGLVEHWREWWEFASSRPNKSRASGRDERICWLELCKLLLALIPQPAYEGRSAGNVVYAKLTGQKSPAPDLRLDNEAFIKMQNNKAYEWRFGGEADSLSELRSLLELLNIVPVPRTTQLAILSKALLTRYRVQVDQAMGELTNEMAITAIGGPMIHNGQLEGIIYAASCPAPFERVQNTALKNRARLGAVRRHQMREHIMRDVLLRAAEGERELSPVLLVLKHIPLLFSVVGAAAVCLHRAESRQRSVGLIWRESTGERQQMRFVSQLGEPRDRLLLEEIRQYARRLAAGPTFSERPVCSGRRDPDTMHLLRAFKEERILMSGARTICAFSVGAPLRKEEWVYLLFFLEEPCLSPGDGRDHLNLETSVSQLWIELEAALDFVFAHRAATEQTVLKLIYTNAAHSLKGPTKIATTFTALAAADLAKGSPKKAQESLAKAQLALQTLRYSTLAAERYFNRLAGTSRKLELQSLEVKDVIEEHVTLFRSIDPLIDLKVKSQGPTVACLAYDDLIRWLLWEMLENSTRTARKVAETKKAMQQVDLTISYRLRSVSVVIVNPAGPLTRADCKILIKNAYAGQPNLSNTSAGSGMGLAYCLWMAQEMKGRFKIDVRQGNFFTTLSLRRETRNG